MKPFILRICIAAIYFVLHAQQLDDMDYNGVEVVSKVGNFKLYSEIL